MLVIGINKMIRFIKNDLNRYFEKTLINIKLIKIMSIKIFFKFIFRLSNWIELSTDQEVLGST